ncbi:MAG: Hsp20/alpha crystallin family protein [Sulfobacillus thermotolerans]|nr:Hsp20/alpha crystallin family protein [Sulfobacillus thermotolerans]
MRFEEWYGVNGVGFVPLTNIVRKDNAFEVDLAVPGYTEDHLHLAIENGVLQIQGTVPEEKDNNQQYIRREIRQRPFRYQVELPDGAETDAIEAHLDLGVLRIRIPLQPKRRITVAVKTPEPVA